MEPMPSPRLACSIHHVIVLTHPRVDVDASGDGCGCVYVYGDVHGYGYGYGDVYGDGYDDGNGRQRLCPCLTAFV